MSGIASQLAAQALAPLQPAEADVLRTLTLTNVAAGAGDTGRIGGLLAGLPLDGDRSPGDAAFLHAGRLHARTQDDFYPEGRVHVGAIALAATLALAERAQRRTLECLVAGYRVMCLLSSVHSAEAQRRGLRPSGVFGPCGAAASAAAALELDEDETANAIALAAVSAGGTNQAWLSGTDEWVLVVGAAARAGVEAALFTRAGVAASRQAFEGDAGWAAALFEQPGAERLAAALADGPPGPDVVAVKPHPVSGIAQVPTALACAVHSELDGVVPDRVEVRVSPIEHAYPGSANRGPFRSRSDALMSIAFCVASGLLEGAVPLRRLEAPNEAGLLDLVGRMTVEPDPALQENEATIAVRTGGREISRHGRTSDILFPRWVDVSGEAEAIARRSEADAGVVKTARDELAREHPDAAVLRRTLEGAS